MSQDSVLFRLFGIFPWKCLMMSSVDFIQWILLLPDPRQSKPEGNFEVIWGSEIENCKKMVLGEAAVIDWECLLTVLCREET